MKHSFHPSVEVLESRIAPATFTVTSNADSGIGSLREAIGSAAGSMGGDIIEFNLAGSTTITLLSSLPAISSTIEFRGDSQPGYAGAPLVTLDGGEMVAEGLFFTMGSAGSKVQALQIQNFTTNGLSVQSNDFVLKGSYIEDNGVNGLFAFNAMNLTIGGPFSSDRNVFTGNTASGIYVTSTNVVIQNNYVGLVASGQMADGNGVGISLIGSSNVTIGGVLPNVISGNAGNGVMMDSSTSVTFNGNIIGLFADKTYSVASRNFGAGVDITFGTGTTFNPQGMGTSRNIIGNNVGPGISLYATQNVTIHGTYIGAVPGGMVTVPAPNGSGIFTTDSTGLSIGSTQAALRNVIGFNTADGIATNGSFSGSVSENIFLNNGELPIDVRNDGPTPNVSLSLDNPMPVDPIANFPILSGGYLDAMNTPRVFGTHEGHGGELYTITLYGFDNETQTYTPVGITSVVGSFQPEPFDAIVSDLTGYERVAAVATNVSYGTSEMSPTALIGAGIAFSDFDMVSQTEGNSGVSIATVTVSLLSVPSGNISVTIGAAPNSTAVAGVDYTLSSTVLNFGPSSTSQTVSVIITGDTVVEPQEFVHLFLGGVMGNGIVVGGTKTVRILNDDTSLQVSADKKTATWRDLDGDLVTLKTSKPILSPGNFQLEAIGTLGGEVLRMLDINSAEGGKGTNLTFSAKFDRSLNQGDGSVHVGAINATGLDLGAVVIPGDLAYILAGDSTLTDGATKSLTVGSMGVLGATQNSGQGVYAFFNGKLGALKVRGDFSGELYSDLSMSANPELAGIGSITIGGSFRATLEHGTIMTSGAIGAIKIGGSMLGETGLNSPEIRADGKIGAVTIAGAMLSNAPNLPVRIFSETTIGKVTVGEMKNAQIFAWGNANPTKGSAALAIAGVTVKGRVYQSTIGAGGNHETFINPDAQIGAITVAGDWVRSSAFAGAWSGQDQEWGTDDDVLATPGAGYSDNPNLVSKIAKVTIAGHVFGDNETPRSTGFVAQQIAAMKVSGAAYTLNPGKIPNGAPLDLVSLSFVGDVKLREIL